MDLHDALDDLAGTVTDDPARLASVHLRYRRHRRTRVAMTAAATAGVVGAALVVGGVAFSGGSGAGPQGNLANGPVWADVTTSNGVQSALGPKIAKRTCGGVPVPPGPATQARPVHVPAGAAPADGGPPMPLVAPTWTGAPPAIGVPFSFSGTVSATTNDSLTIAVQDGPGDTGMFVMPSACDPPLAVVGGQAKIAGTRTGTNTYNITTIAIRIDRATGQPAQV